MRKAFLFALGSLAASYAALSIVGRRLNTWGATPEESAERAPGEEYLAHPKIESTLAVNILAPPEYVWPWLVQIGRGRGGFYTYTWLENLFGSEIQNVSQIIPELQELRIGDRIQIHPKVPSLAVTNIFTNRYLTLEGWIFQLKPHESGGTRLVSRTYSIAPNPRLSRFWNFFFQTPFWQLAHFIMQRKMLLTIKLLAEESLHTGVQIKEGTPVLTAE